MTTRILYLVKRISQKRGCICFPYRASRFTRYGSKAQGMHIYRVCVMQR